MIKYKYFNENDFIKAIPSCNIDDMEPLLLEMLDDAREISGIPFVLNSAYRSKSWELSKGRSGSSSHTMGLAVDIKCNCSYDRLVIVKALLNVGFRRIGIYDDFIHVDIDDLKLECMWLG